MLPSSICVLQLLTEQHPLIAKIYAAGNLQDLQAIEYICLRISVETWWRLSISAEHRDCIVDLEQVTEIVTSW